MNNNNYYYKHANSGYPVNFELVNIYDKLLEHERAVLLPIQSGTKRPSISEWQKVKFEDTQAAEYRAMLEAAFNKAAIGVQLGNGIFAIDVDNDDLADKFLELNPRLLNTLRTRGARGCQFWIKIDGKHPESCKLKLSGKEIGEWRANGQSVIYGQHPSGPRYQVLTQEKPATIKFEEINWPKHWTANFIKCEEPKKDTKLDKRITEYVAEIPSAIDGQGGHSQTYTVACILTWGFALSEAQALPYFETYNARCEPPWERKDLLHKLADSIKDTTHKKPRGHLLGDTPRDEKDAQDAEQAAEREMTGGSILDFANAPVDTTATLLGDRYLCRGGGMFVVAPSGQGKSSLSCQLAVEWSIGGDPIGIKAVKPLRVLIIQGEDDQGDVTEMTKWVMNAGFSQEKLSMIGRNTHIETVNNVVGDKFIKVLDNFCGKWMPDIVIINPYTSFLGKEPKDDEAANRFLREGLTPLLHKHGCAAVIMHHTPKTQFNPSADFTTTDFMYRGAGCASMTNWARAYLVFEPVNEEKLFRFVAAKRGQRIGWESAVRFYRHSRVPGEIKWLQASTEEVDAAVAKKSKGKPQVEEEKLLSVFSLVDTIAKSTAEKKMMDIGASQSSARSAIKRFIDEELILVAEQPTNTKGWPHERFVLAGQS
jgi:hypothetical protein